MSMWYGCSERIFLHTKLKTHCKLSSGHFKFDSQKKSRTISSSAQINGIEEEEEAKKDKQQQQQYQINKQTHAQ